MTIDSYGGNPDIIASRDEIYRVAGQLELASKELTQFGSIEAILEDPIALLHFRYQALAIYSKLEQLYNRCILAAEGYFTTEAQIHRRFELTFVPELARVVQSLAVGMGWNLDRGVAVQKIKTGVAAPPLSISQLLGRLEKLSESDQAKVGVDLYEDEAGKLAVVYIPGTKTLGFGTEPNPLDMASNLQAMAGANQAASERAILLAMSQAGVGADHSVIFVGHSQGGLVAANLTANPHHFLVAGLVTFGAPLAHLKISKVPVMAIEHSNDPVPQFSGKANPLRSNWVTIQREAARSESKALIHAHSMESYTKTAAEVDASNRKGIRNIKSKILGFFNSKKAGKSNNFVIQRITEF